MSDAPLRFLQQENSRLQEENKGLREENSALRERLRAVGELYAALQRLESTETPLTLLDELLHKSMGVIGAKDGSISRLDHFSGELEFVLVHGEIWRELRGYRIKPGTGIAGWVVNEREPLIVNDPRQDWRFSLEVDQEFGFVTRSIVCVPIIAHDQLIGVIELLNKSSGAFNETDLAVLAMLSQVAAKILTAVPT